MFKNINVIDPDAFLQSFKDYDCGKNNLIEFSAKIFEAKQHETFPLEGYEPPANFPFCCENHKGIFNIGLEHLEKFPNCCEAHKKLNSAKWFNKKEYSYLPLKLVNTISYTFHCIGKCIDNDNWYKEITDYIEITRNGYGQFPEGYGAPLGLHLYLYNLQRNIEATKEMPEPKKSQLLNYIEKYFELEKEKKFTDVNLLISTYKKWLKFFPFELSFFNDLKPHFENQIPILSGKGETNIYDGFTKFKTKTKKELVEFLISITENIICEINTLSLFEKGLINDIQKTKIEIINGKRRLELNEIKNRPELESKQYIKTLKQWFNGEQEYLRNITPFIKSLPQSKTELKAPVIALFCSIINETKIINKGEAENVENYCKKVCKKFNLTYSDRVRQGFLTSENNANIQKIKELILSKIDKPTSKLILEHLSKKQQSKQKLYS